MNRYVCIHGHFYQPPRENPWLEAIEVQDSAFPYRDWNERITAECYNPNSAARIQGSDGTVLTIVNNYSKISFNFGPTLLSWMQVTAPDVYESILRADAESQEFFSGHGSAIAQVYNHMIMPLANSRDKRTQVIWGKEDFVKRFNREPEGMWLAETAVDIESLDILAEFGIKYTILAPRQAARIKLQSDEEWIDVSDARIDPKMPYLCRLPSGRTINLFFYDGPISQELAFGDLLKDGTNLANRLIGTFNSDESPQLVHIATDGETYGHHSKHGDMALAYCLDYIDKNNLADITVYGEYLEKNPPTHEVEIIENTSWSCIHGIERWRNDCGCNTGRAGWNQQWRAPLRAALDWLRDKLVQIYEEEIAKFNTNAWKLRDEYIKVILDRNPENIDTFFKDNGIGNVSHPERINILRLLEMQRHAMLMYTSCGWFFDEITGIETVQVIMYAGRAIQLAKQVAKVDLDGEFSRMLEAAKSNIAEFKNGSYAYEMFVKPAVVDLLRVAAHFSISSLFDGDTDKAEIFSYEVYKEKLDVLEAGRQKLLIGRSRMRSRITEDESTVSYGVLHIGDQNINGGVREFVNEATYEEMHAELKDAFERNNLAEIILGIDKHFGSHNYSLWHLFKDERRKIFNIILANTLNETEFFYRQIYENHYSLIQAIKENMLPLPKAISNAVDFVINYDIRKILESPEEIDLQKLVHLAQEAAKLDIKLDRESLGLAVSNRIIEFMQEFENDPLNEKVLARIVPNIQVLVSLPVDHDLWKAQNILFYISKDQMDIIKKKAKRGVEKAKRWMEQFKILEQSFQIKIS